MKPAITFCPYLLTAALFLETSVSGQAPFADEPGWSLEFDGVNQFVEVPHQEALNAFPLTITLWFKTDQQSAYLLIAKSRTYRPAGGYRVALIGGSVFASYAQDPQHTIPLKDMELMLADGAWHQVAMAVDTNGGRLFIDGNLRDEQPWSAPGSGPPTTTEPVLLASYQGNPTNFYSGLMDEVAIWNRSLSQAELRTNLYKPLQATEPGLLAYWRMDEGTGTALADSTTNHFDAYLTNNPAWVKSCIPAAKAALRSNGPDGFLRVPNFGGAAPSEEITVEFWANVGGEGPLFSLAPDDPLNQLAAGVISSSGAIVWRFGREDEGSLLYVPSLAITNTWQHFALVSSRAGNFMRIYRNGELAASRSGASRLVPGESDLLVGGGVGAVAEFRIWSVARRQGEIARDLHHQLQGPQPGLELCYQFDERSGQTAADASGRKHPGFLSKEAEWLPFPVDLAPSVTTLPVTGVDLANATLNAVVDPNGLLSSAWFEWGTNMEQAPRVMELGLGSATLPLTLQLTGLVAGVTYQYRVGASNTAGLTFGETRWFIPALPAVVDTLPATGIHAEYAETSAILHGTVVPNWSPTLAWFIWGPDSLCLNATAPVPVGNGTNQIFLSAELAHLPAEGIYHYRMAASNTLGLVVGPEETFWAPGIRLEGPRVMKVPQASAFRDPGARVARPIMSLSAGSAHCLALTYDGRVFAWGSTAPLDLTDVVAISAGSGYSLAVKNDGRIVAWGANDYRRCDVPVSLTNAVAVGAGESLSIAATSSGTADYWGAWMVLGPGDAHPDLPELTDIVAVDAGADVLLELRKSGTVVLFSSVMSGTPAGLTNVVAIDVNYETCAALQRNGLVTVWGGGTGPQPPGLSNVIAIANGDFHFLALRRDASLVGWWYNGAEHSIPTGLSNLVAVAAGYWTNYVLDVSGRVSQWDTRSSAEVSVTNLAAFARPVEVTGYVDTTTAGVYGVTYKAASPRGIAGIATRAVIVEMTPAISAREMKSNVLARLAVMLAGLDPGPARERLSQAAELLHDSLTPLFWTDGNHIIRGGFGTRVFEGEEAALLNLDLLLVGEHPGISTQDLQDCIAGLVQADRILAACAIQDAAQESSEPRHVFDAWQRVMDADRLAAAGDLVGAIEGYEMGWHYSALLQLRITGRCDAGVVSLDFPFIPGARYEIEASANLLDWALIATGAAGPDGLAHYEQTLAGQSPRFYRVKVSDDLLSR